MFSSLRALSGRTLEAVEQHIFVANGLANAFYLAGGKPASTPFSTLREHRGSFKGALAAFAMERVSIRIFYKKHQILGKSKKALIATLQFIEDLEGGCPLRDPDPITGEIAPPPAGLLAIPLALQQGSEKVAQFLHSNGEALLLKSRPVLRVLSKAGKEIVKPVIYATFFGAVVVLSGFHFSYLVAVGQSDKREDGEEEKIPEEVDKIEGAANDDEDAWVTDEGSFGSENDVTQIDAHNQLNGKEERKEESNGHDVEKQEEPAAAVHGDEVNAHSKVTENEGIVGDGKGLANEDIELASEEAEAYEQLLDSSNFDVERALVQIRAGDIGAANAEPLTPAWLGCAREQSRAGLLAQDDSDDLSNATPPPSNLLPHFKALANAAQVSARKKAITKAPNAKPGTPLKKRRGRGRKAPLKPTVILRSLRTPRSSPLSVKKARFDLTPRRPQTQARASSSTPPSAPSARISRHRRKYGLGSTFNQYYLQNLEHST